MDDSNMKDLQLITLPQPIFDQCGTVFEALEMRRTSRAINDKKIPLQLLSDILWAAQGANRPHGPFEGPGSPFRHSNLHGGVIVFRGNWIYTALIYHAELHVMKIFPFIHSKAAIDEIHYQKRRLS
jgi:hypothetical protein